MLSVSYTIIDVKDKLQNIYSYFGYSSDEEFTGILTSISEDVMRLYLYPRLGTTAYATLAAKDKTSITEVVEEALYWAEVYSICYEFLRFHMTVSGQIQTSGDEDLQVEGYSYKTKAGSGASPNDKSLNGYMDKMLEYYKLAGYDIMSLQRTCTIFGDSVDYDDIINIIE